MSSDSLNVVWVVTAAILVFFMQAGFAFLESGMVRSKNSVNVLMKNYIDMCFGALAYWAFGYGLMFGANPTGWIGTDLFLVSGADSQDYSILFFQMMFAATAATIVSGALAERIRYSAYVACAVLVTALVYPIFGSWVWGGSGETEGWLRRLGFIDFAGSTVVHSIGGWSALAGIMVLGPRLGRFGKVRRNDAGEKKKPEIRSIPGHSLPTMALGAFILWFGFFGFNAGSTLEAGPLIGKIALNTHLSGSGGVIGAILTLLLMRKPILMTFSINGGLGGLVAICAGANVMEPGFAILTGLIGGVFVTQGTLLMEKFLQDDPVGAVSAHGIAGAWGTVAVAFFDSGNYFDVGQIGIQLLGVLAGFLWAFPLSWVIFHAVDKLMTLRVDSIHEQRGLDFAEHYEIGYPEFQQELLHPGKK